jgi:NADH:ubiquinone oxidoreductase subunit E
MNKITICMGSSCFARGNGEHLELIEEYLERNKLQAKIELAGSRCRNDCADGPMIDINGKTYRKLDQGMLLDLLEYHFKGTPS